MWVGWVRVGLSDGSSNLDKIDEMAEMKYLLFSNMI
jgi:hypothetical protein